MIVYQVDGQTHTSAAQQIRDLSTVLNEMAPTLEVLQNLLAEHGQSISTPTIDRYRQDLQQTVSSTIKQCHVIAANSQQLCLVSEQAAKHLTSIDDHFANALGEPAPQRQLQAIV